MSKSLSLLFAIASVLMLVFTGLALGFGRPRLAFLCVILFVVICGIGFMLKALFSRQSQNTLTKKTE